VEGQERVLRFMVPGGDRQVVTRNSGAGKVGELASDWVGAAPEEALGATQVLSVFKRTEKLSFMRVPMVIHCL
jgi:hypothetical protein